MAPGESVRVCYVAATRMVSVVWRGRAYDLAALPATADIAHMRFGVALAPGNSMRVTGASAGARCKCIRVRMCSCFLLSFTMLFTRRVCSRSRATQRTTSCQFVVRTRVMCQAGRARAAGAHGDIVAWLCERPPLWVVVHV